MKKIITTSKPDATAMVEAAWQTVGESFDHFCLTAGIATLEGMMEEDAERLCGPRHGRLKERDGTAGDERRAGWPSMAGRSRSGDRVCADAAASLHCRAGRLPDRRTGSASGR